MKPNVKTKFKKFSEIEKYIDKDKYFCNAVVFSPETENDHFAGCPPYIEIVNVDYLLENREHYFEVPEIIAYYAKTHPAYTMKGIENWQKQGARDLANKIKVLLNIK